MQRGLAALLKAKNSSARKFLERIGLLQLLAPPAAAQTADESPADEGERSRWIMSHTGLAWRAYHFVFLVLNSWDALVLPLLLVNFELTAQLSWVWPTFYFLDAVYVVRIVLRLFVT